MLNVPQSDDFYPSSFECPKNEYLRQLCFYLFRNLLLGIVLMSRQNLWHDFIPELVDWRLAGVMSAEVREPSRVHGSAKRPID